MSRVKETGDALAVAVATITSLPSSFTFVPTYNATSGASVIVSPVSSSTTQTSRDGATESISYQVVVISPVTYNDASGIDALYTSIESIKDYLTGNFIESSNYSYYVNTVISSGTTALSSSDIAGGFIDSKQLGECCVFQSPLIVEVIRYK